MSIRRTRVHIVSLALGVAVCATAAAWYSLHRHESPAHALEVRAIAHEWWWEFDYPALGIRDTNELHVPSGVNVHLNLASADVIHSFWIPGINQAIQIIPGALRVLNFLVNSPARFYGNCDAGCGCKTVCMRFLVVADSPANFNNWVKRRRSGGVDSHTQYRNAAPACALKLQTMLRTPSPAVRTGGDLNENVYSAHARHDGYFSDYIQTNPVHGQGSR